MSEAENAPEDYVTVAGQPHLFLPEVIRRLGIDRRTAYRWRDAGKLTHRHYLGRVCCPADQVIRLQIEREGSNADQ
jgi:predicted site-specific integrase-resolvase